MFDVVDGQASTASAITSGCDVRRMGTTSLMAPYLQMRQRRSEEVSPTAYEVARRAKVRGVRHKELSLEQALLAARNRPDGSQHRACTTSFKALVVYCNTRSILVLERTTLASLA